MGLRWACIVWAIVTWFCGMRCGLWKCLTRDCCGGSHHVLGYMRGKKGNMWQPIMGCQKWLICCQTFLLVVACVGSTLNWTWLPFIMHCMIGCSLEWLYMVNNGRWWWTDWQQFVTDSSCLMLLHGLHDWIVSSGVSLDCWKQWQWISWIVAIVVLTLVTYAAAIIYAIIVIGCLWLAKVVVDD